MSSYRYDRTGERVDDEPRVHECDQGWIEIVGRVSPCPVCRPEVYQRLQDRQRKAVRA